MWCEKYVVRPLCADGYTADERKTPLAEKLRILLRPRRRVKHAAIRQSTMTAAEFLYAGACVYGAGTVAIGETGNLCRRR